MNIEDKLRDTPEPFHSNEWIDMELLITNLNILLGYMHDKPKASRTIWYAEQTIKNFISQSEQDESIMDGES